MSVIRLLAAALVLVAAPAAAAPEFPALSGRVVDGANIIPDADEAALTRKLEGVEQASSRQLVVATIPDLQDYPIEDYGYQLGRHWGLGQKGANNGIILIVAPNERKVRIEVGYGLEPIMTDALASNIISDRILPAFKAGNYPQGIMAGADAIIEQLQAPTEVAEQKALAAGEARQASEGDGEGIITLIFWGIVLVFVIFPMIGRGRRGRRHRRGGVFVWGPGLGGGSSWGGGSSGGGFGGFSGGGGSFGGGGASGGW